MAEKRQHFHHLSRLKDVAGTQFLAKILRTSLPVARVRFKILGKHIYQPPALRRAYKRPQADAVGVLLRHEDRRVVVQDPQRKAADGDRTDIVLLKLFDEADALVGINYLLTYQ